MDDKQSLIASLAHWLASGKLDIQFGLPAIRALSSDGSRPKSILGVLEAIRPETDPTLVSLAAHLRDKLRLEAFRLYRKRKAGQALSEEELTMLGGFSSRVTDEWRFGGASSPVEAAIQMALEAGLLGQEKSKAPHGFHEVRARLVERLAAAYQGIAPQMEQISPQLLKRLESAWPSDWPGRDAVLSRLGKPGDKSSSPRPSDGGEGGANEDKEFLDVWRARLAAAESQEEKARVLDGVCSWPTPTVLPLLREMTVEPWAADRAMFNLTLRFGQPHLNSWEQWSDWLADQAELWAEEEAALARLIQQQPIGLLLILYSQGADADPAVFDALLTLLYKSGPPLEPRDVIQTWARFIPVNEQRALLGVPEPKPPPLPPVIEEAAREERFAGETPGGTGGMPVLPRRPSVWENHIQPLFVENWYIVAGIAMVILGSSLLAYYTWDKHWLVRYTIMPSLLALFTWSLAGAGRWIEKKGMEFKTTAAILRAAAIGLLPINFMAMALLSADDAVPQKATALLVMAIVYLSLFGWGLRNWCGAVEPALRNSLAGALLLLNSLVAVGPLARTLGHLEGRSLLIALGTGFYLGFLVSGWTIVRFARRILTREMAGEKRVPWFVASALAITFVEVFIWVHAFMRHLPRPHTYALLVIMIGWLVLYSERRALDLRETPQAHGGESFLGFAFLLLGLLMGFSEPWVRVLSFSGAGAVWGYQSLSRRHPLHYWISLTLFGLGIASVGLLPEYPGPWLPLLGILAALGFGLGIRLCQGTTHTDLLNACRGMQLAALFLTTMIAPLVQWHYHSEPFGTAIWLLIVATLFAWRAWKDQEVRWVHATMTVMALVLPYLGFVDMAGRTAHHNTMVFGLAAVSGLWLLATNWAGRKVIPPVAEGASPAVPLLLQARSTVLFFYGSLAVAAMVLRLTLGDNLPSPLWYRDYMDYSGPILMALVLIPATYYSRSLVPASIAVAMMTILFPELKANLQQSLPWLSWGSGLASSISGLVLVTLCFLLRAWAFLRKLPEGDRFMKRELFPFRRYDHTLFTWPLMAAILFLIIKVDVWNLFRNLAGGGVGFKTAAALGITGIAWTLVGIYRREERRSIACVHLGWICALAGINFGYWHGAANPYWTTSCLISGLFLQGLYWVYRFGLQPRFPWARSLLTEPTRWVLVLGSGGLAMVCIAALVAGTPLHIMQWLSVFVAAELAWHALRIKNPIFGTLVYFQIWIGLLSATAPAAGPLWERISVQNSLTPTLCLLLGIQLLFLLLEPSGARDAKAAGPPASPLPSRPPSLGALMPLLLPPFVIASGFAIFLGLAGFADGVQGFGLSLLQQSLLLALLLIAARAHASAFFALIAMLLGYVMGNRAALGALPSPKARFDLLITPWRAALLGLAMVLVAEATRRLHRRKTTLVAGPFAQDFFTAPSAAWVFWPATAIAGLAALYQTFDPSLREIPVQLWAPYLGVITFSLVAWFWRTSGFLAGAGFLLLAGNIHLVRVFGGEFLREHGLSELHLICIGSGLTLLQISVVRRLIRMPALLRPMALANLGLAGSILVLLSANYFTEPALAGISSTRFIVSGVLAWLAGWYFREAARNSTSGEEAQRDLCEALYHFGLVLAIWCAALLVPWLRRPFFTLIALGLPAAWFYLRAELGIRAGRPEARRYRTSSAVLGFVVLGLYVLKGVFHMILFPGTSIGVEYYHYNAPLIMVLGILLLRLHGLGGTSWLAFYGGLALMTGSYFSLTAIRGLSPFTDPMPSAWCGVGLGHFWILLSHARSPLRTLIQRFARLDELAWHSLRRSWGWCLLAATHAAVIWGVTDYSSNTFMVAPLLAGAASILLHQGIIRSRAIIVVASSIPQTGTAAPAPTLQRSHPPTLYFIAAGVELALALHMDFLLPSYLPKEQVIWVILGIWLVLLAAHQIARGKLQAESLGPIAIALGLLVCGHVVYHRPWSQAGLWAVALGAILAAWTPQRERRATNGVGGLCAALLLLVPAWLVYFSQVNLDQNGLPAAFETWPVLAATTAIFLMGLFARLFPVYWAAAYGACKRSHWRLFDSTLAWLQTAGRRLHQGTLWFTLAVVGVIQVLHYQTPFATREIVLLALMEAALIVAWYWEGKARSSMLAYYLMQIAAVALGATLRRQLMLTTNFWTYEYDVWASLAASLGLAGAKQVFDRQPRSLRVPLLTSMLALPACALGWVLFRGLGVNMALLVVGLQSVMFAYLGKDERASPYNIVALAGFVAFIMVTFYSKLQFRAVHAYIIPTGLGVLVLQELFRDRIAPESKHWIRLVTLMAMLGSAGYYALVDPNHAITFNLTLIILGLLAMALGSFLRIRLYLVMGFAGLMVDLVSLLYKVLVHMERGSRMTTIGILVLGLGGIVVFGAIYYKTNKADFDEWIERRRLKFARWQ